MVKNREINGTGEIALVTPTPDVNMMSSRNEKAFRIIVRGHHRIPLNKSQYCGAFSLLVVTSNKLLIKQRRQMYSQTLCAKRPHAFISSND